MKAFLEMNEDRRRLVCEQTAARMGLFNASVEKDFWVCFILERLFSLPRWGKALTFKGGTSLSKGWKLIERFSEDIDIVIDRKALGFDGDSAPDSAPSKNQTNKRLDALRTSAQEAVHKSIAPALDSALIDTMPAGMAWELTKDDSDRDGQTLLFTYPTVFADQPEYLRQVVKIEMGARSDIDPSTEITVEPFISEILPNLFPSSQVKVRCVNPVRTFWEKAMLLHEETYRPEEKKRAKRGLARHYYDLYQLLENGHGEKAAQDHKLFERIVEHRRVYFRHNWMDYDTLAPGSLRVVPLPHQLSAWRQDYEAMRMEMFYGEVPSFDALIEAVKSFQDNFNKS